MIEVLIVLAIIGLMFALVSGSVQNARAAAARAHCGNNLRQIGLALHQHHDTKKALPAGVKSRRRSEPQPGMSWLTQLLPYMEQAPLWRATIDAYEFQRLPFYELPHIGFMTPMPLFSCPADARPSEPQKTHRNLTVALTSYVGVLGTDYRRTDGVLFLDSRVRLDGIQDGTSNTLAVGERPPSADHWYGWWYAGFGQRGTGSADMLLGVREINDGGPYLSPCSSGPYHFGAGIPGRQCDVLHFWSPHSGGGQFLFADGGVRFLGYAADSIMPALATRASGDLVGDGVE
ncbi:MAG: DUF1559 domain-containing protein [Gemmataceae bacterium]